MSLISLNEIKLSFGEPLLFDNLNLQIEKDERVALIGRNGVGKTSLMKVIAGELDINDGKISYQKGIQVTHLPQEIPKDIRGKTFDIVLSGLGDRAKLINDYYYLNIRLNTKDSPELLRTPLRIQTSSLASFLSKRALCFSSASSSICFLCKKVS